eukprot:2528053-Lingulodinium_polyedra.AAC.1
MCLGSVGTSACMTWPVAHQEVPPGSSTLAVWSLAPRAAQRSVAWAVMLSLDQDFEVAPTKPIAPVHHLLLQKRA